MLQFIIQPKSIPDLYSVKGTERASRQNTGSVMTFLQVVIWLTYGPDLLDLLWRLQPDSGN